MFDSRPSVVERSVFASVDAGPSATPPGTSRHQVTEEALRHLEQNALLMRQDFQAGYLHLCLARKRRAALLAAR